MKRVRINEGNVGVVTRKGDYKRIVTAGSHWIGLAENVTVYDMAKMYTSTRSLNIYLNDPKFKSQVEIVDVGDNEIVLKYDGNNFESVLTRGRQFYFKGLMNFKFVKINLSDPESAVNCDASIMRNASVAPFVYEAKIESYEEGLLFVDGKFVRTLTKGLYFFWKSVKPVEVLKVDTRLIQLEVSGQEMLTKDKAALRLNFQATYKVVNAEVALLVNKSFEKQLYGLIQLALREFVGTLTLDELLEAKEKVSESVLASLKMQEQSLGVEVSMAGIRDIILPGEVRDIMNKVLVAQKSAEANTIARREETAATRTLLNTAKLMEDNPMLYKLKEMEFVEKIAGNVGEVSLSSGGQVIDQLTKIFSK